MKFYTTSKISENLHETPEGYLVCVGVAIARTGDMDYGAGETPLEVGENGRVVISRAAEEVFRPETLASFEGKAVTILHPTDFVSPENWSSLAKGVIQNVRRGEGAQESDLVADLLITDSVAISLVKNGLREVSCGYEAEYVQTGVGRGVQKNIIGNHLALVDEGRAGASYAINDHKGKDSRMKKLGEKIKSIFAKAQDEALAAAVADAAEEEKPKEEPAKDAAACYDDVMKAVKDLGEKVAAMAPKEKKADDATTKATGPNPSETVAKDEEVAPGLEERLKKVEEMLAKLMQSQAGDEEPGDDVVADEDGDEEESEDDGFEESTMTGDTASRIEILAPGLAASGKDAKAKAVKAAYATKDGKAVIDQLTGGKGPDLKDAKQVEMLFVAGSELLKVSRTATLASTKTHDFKSNLGEPKGAMTAEEMNARNAKHYGVAK